MKKVVSSITLILLVVSIVLNSCRKDDLTPEPNPNSLELPVSGTVIDVYGNPVQEVTVKAGNYITTTDLNGTFYLPTANFSAKRFEITFEKQGYFTLHRSGVPQPGMPVVLSIGMISENDFHYSAKKTFNSSQPDTLYLPDGSSVIFPSNAFVTANNRPYNGSVVVKGCYADPTLDKYGMFVFGGDLYAQDSEGHDVYLNPFAGLNVVIEDPQGNPLQLDSANNKKAIVLMKIPPKLQAEAPNTIDMYVYAPPDTSNRGKGVKQGKGSAVKTGDSYQGEVRHFSFWSCEKTYSGHATIYGYVKKRVKGEELPIGGFPVRVGTQIVVTNCDGKYEVKVPDNLPGIEISSPTEAFDPHTLTFALSDGEFYKYDISITSQYLYAIYGIVYSNTRQPIKNAMVSVSYYDNTVNANKTFITFSDQNGFYSLLVQGRDSQYTIKVQTAKKQITEKFYISGDTEKDLLVP